MFYKNSCCRQGNMLHTLSKSPLQQKSFIRKNSLSATKDKSVADPKRTFRIKFCTQDTAVVCITSLLYI